MSNDKAYRPQPKTIRRVVEHLEAIGLSVYGPNLDLEDGEELAGLRDYGPDDIVKYCRLIETDATWYDENRRL